MDAKCRKCDREFTDQPNEYPGKVYVHHGETACEDCLVGMSCRTTPTRRILAF